jgi:hypothetical protein
VPAYILYINNVRARKSLSGKWYSKKLYEAPGFSRGSAVEICFWIFAESLKIYGAGALTLVNSCGTILHIINNLLVKY